MRQVYINGEFKKEDEAKVSVFDRGLLFSDSLYEVITVINGKLIDFNNHMKRLDRSMTELKFKKLLNHKDILVKYFVVLLLTDYRTIVLLIFLD